MNTKNWFVDKFGNVEDSNGETIALVCTSMTKTENEIVKNANLLAAAPELLAAIEKMTYLADDSGKFLQLQDFIETAQAVIAKAKGE